VHSSPVKKIKKKCRQPGNSLAAQLRFDSRAFSLSRPKQNLSQIIISHAEEKFPPQNFNLCHRRLAPRAPLTRRSPPRVSFEPSQAACGGFQQPLARWRADFRLAEGQGTPQPFPAQPLAAGFGREPACPWARPQGGGRPSPPPGVPRRHCVASRLL